MHCEQARQLFDAYLDGELSPSLATELGAHRLRCADCRQALALHEVSGHILRSDRDPVQPSDDFTDRLLACVDSAPSWRRKVLNSLYIGGPLAAAAVIALAFIGVFDGKRPSQVAGVKQVAAPSAAQSTQPGKPTATATAPAQTVDPAEQALGEFFDQTQQRMKDKGESVQRVLDLTVLQMLDILEEAKDRSQAGMKPDASPWPAPEDGPAAQQGEREDAGSDEGEEDPGDVVAPESKTDPPND
jgi:hypothetical protein